MTPDRQMEVRRAERPELATRETGPYEVTQYLQWAPANCRKALCGKPNPTIDLRPVNGAITCNVCLDLWAQGYRGPDA